MGAINAREELHTPVADPTEDGENTDSDTAELNRRLGQSLSDLARAGGSTSWIAGRMATVGNWIQREAHERKQTIGGIDNMWLLMSEATDSDFNPVRTTICSTSVSCLHDATGLCVYVYAARKIDGRHACSGMAIYSPSHVQTFSLAVLACSVLFSQSLAVGNRTTYEQVPEVPPEVDVGGSNVPWRAFRGRPNFPLYKPYTHNATPGAGGEV